MQNIVGIEITTNFQLFGYVFGSMGLEPENDVAEDAAGQEGEYGIRGKDHIDLESFANH